VKEIEFSRNDSLRAIKFGNGCIMKIGKLKRMLKVSLFLYTIDRNFLKGKHLQNPDLKFLM